MNTMNTNNHSLGSNVERIFLVTLVTLVVGLAFLLIFLLDLQVTLSSMRFALLASVGLAAGIASRQMLAGRHFLLRLTTSWFAILITLAVLSGASTGFVGVDLSGKYPALTGWEAGLELAIPGVVAWLVLLAWARGRREIVVEPRASITTSAPAAPRTSLRNSGRSSRVRTTQASSRVSLVERFNGWRTRTSLQLVSMLPRPAVNAPKTRKAKPSTARKVSGKRSRSTVHFSGVEKHVCPYCLEPVKKNDPRGVKICKVCKTWHHADCWEITGVCQVPHEYVN